MVNNKVYIDTLIVSGIIDSDLLNEHPDVIESIKNIDINIKRFLDIYFKYKIELFIGSYIFLCERVGKMLDRDKDVERSKEFLDKLCDVLELRAQVLSNRTFSKSLVNVSHLVDISSNNLDDIDYKNMYRYMNFMKLHRLNNGAKIKIKNISNDTYFIERGSRQSIDLEGEFDLKDIHGKIRFNNISMIVIRKDKIDYIASKVIKTKDVKEQVLRRYIEDSNVRMILIYDTTSDEFMINKITGDYITVNLDE